jgi:hypothetical protein
MLADLSSHGRAAAAEVDASLGLGETITREELLSRLQTAQSDDEFETLVALGRPLLDYAFFQNLTAQIEAAPDTETASHLKVMRSKILDSTAKQDEEARAAMQRASSLLKDILQAEDPQTVVRQHLDEINDTFFVVLSANIQHAEAQNRKDVAQALQQLADLIITLIEERLPPEVRLINQLVNASYPDDTRKLLEARREILTPEFVITLDRLIADLEQAGNADVADHMKQVKAQAELLSQGVLQP